MDCSYYLTIGMSFLYVTKNKTHHAVPLSLAWSWEGEKITSARRGNSTSHKFDFEIPHIVQTSLVSLCIWTTNSNIITQFTYFVCFSGGKTMLPHILQNIPPLMSSADWKCRHAALMAISACGEGCHKQMETMLGQILESIIPFTR